MKYSNKLIKISVCMIVAGIVLSGIGYIMGGKTTLIKGKNISIVSDDSERIVKNQNLEKFENINIDVDLDYVELIKSNENKLELDYSKDYLDTVDYKIENNTLIIKQNTVDTVGIRLNLFGDTKSSYLKLYINDESVLNNINISSSNTGIKMSSINSENIDLKCDYSDVELNNISANKMNINIKDGNISIDNINISNHSKLKNSYGNISISNSKFNNLVSNLNDGNLKVSNTTYENSIITNDYGDVKLSDVLSKNLKIECKDGSINIEGELQGNTVIDNNYGNVDVVSNQSENLYDYSIMNKYGYINIDNKTLTKSIIKNEKSKYTLNINSSDGDINVKFK